MVEFVPKFALIWNKSQNWRDTHTTEYRFGLKLYGSFKNGLSLSENWMKSHLIRLLKFLIVQIRSDNYQVLPFIAFWLFFMAKHSGKT